MAATAEKVTPIEEGKDLVQFGKALVKFDIKEQVIQDLEEATRLEITDTTTEKVVRKHRQNAKFIQVRIEKTRLQLNREFKEKTDAAAALIAPRIAAAYDKLDEKVKVIEAEREARKAEKEEAERLRMGKIQWRMDGLEYDCTAGLEYNLPYSGIAHCLNTLHDIKISAVDFQEQTEAAERMLAEGIHKTERAYKDRVDWEEQQAEAARVKAEQEAEAKRLADERAKMEAEQKARDEEARRIAEEEAEKRRQEEEKLQAEREALEAEKKRIQNVVQVFADIDFETKDAWDIPERLNDQYKSISSYWVDPDFLKERMAEFETFLHSQLIEIKNRLHELAIADHAEYKRKIEFEIDGHRHDAKKRWEATEKAREEAAARAKLVEPDKKTLAGMLTVVDNFISDFNPLDGEYKTNEAAQIELDLIVKIKKAIEEATEAAEALR